MLTEGDEVVGAYVAYYSNRLIDDQIVRFCNLGAWCVLDAHRFQGVKLLQALLAQDGYHFTDLSPSGNVIPLNKRLKFEVLDTTTALVPNLPWPTIPGRCQVTANPAILSETLEGNERNIYRDHRHATAVKHLLITADRDHCHVMFRRDSRKGLRLFASILYVSNQEMFLRYARQLTRHLLVRYAIPATLLELRVGGGRPRSSILLSNSRPKMFKSDSLDAHEIDYLYSELTCLAW